MATSVWLISLNDLDPDACAIQLGAVAGLELAPGQGEFVGDPLRMALVGLAEQSRRPYVIEAGGEAVGVLTLQSGAARLAGWPDDDSAWLLRGFLIDRRHQGKGLGPLAAAAAAESAAKLTARQGSGETGVVLSVNERNPAGLSAYRRAGFVDYGAYPGGSSGPQRTMFRGFYRKVPAGALPSAPLCPIMWIGSVLQTLLGGRLEQSSSRGALVRGPAPCLSTSGVGSHLHPKIA